MNRSVKRVMKNLKDNETINAFGEIVEKGAGDYGNHFHQLDLFKQSLKEIQNEMDELVEKFEALDYLVGSNAEEESNYWEMKAESHYGL